MQILNSSILAVTVYPQQAQVSRQAKTSLQPGMQTVVFKGLSPHLDSNSVQVSGDTSLLLHDIKTEKIQLQQVAHTHQETLKAREKELQQKKRAMELRQTRFQKEQALLEGLGRRITTATEDSQAAEWDPANWQKLLEFYAEQLERLDLDLLKLEKELQSLNEELDQLKRTLQGLGGSTRSEWQVSVQVEVETEGEYELGLSYLVHQASWKPLYDLRVNSEEQTVGLAYKARIHQNTGEDWKEVALSLSTSRPSIGGNPPEIKPQYIQPYEPPRPVTRSWDGPEEADMAIAQPMAESQAPPLKKRSAPAPTKMRERTVEVEEQLIAARFHLEGAYTVASDNQGQQVSLGQFGLSAKFVYLSVPRLQQTAFLQAEMTNDSPFTLLPGQGSVFLDGHFVALTRLESVAIGETFTQGLGIDEAIKVEHALHQRFRKSQGLMSKRDRQTYRYRLQFVNHKKRSVQIEIQDRYPFSQDEQIKVELIEPAYKGETESLARTDQHILKWQLELNPGAEKELWLEYAVSFPEGMRVDGL